MANVNDKLAGACIVNQITCDKHGILLKPELLEPHGFTHNQTPTVLVTQGHIFITLDPLQQNILKAIQELQFREDESKQDFTPAIEWMVNSLKRA